MLRVIIKNIIVGVILLHFRSNSTNAMSFKIIYKNYQQQNLKINLNEFTSFALCIQLPLIWQLQDYSCIRIIKR